MKIRFTKMHGLGNDFVVIDAIHQSISLTPEQARFLADRRFGVGCDQILIVERPTQDGVDFRYRIFNADGSEVEQCGNGARCFVRFVVDQHLTEKHEIRVETKSGIIAPRLEGNGEVTVNMGAPIFEAAKIPFIVAEGTSQSPGRPKIDSSAHSGGGLIANEQTGGSLIQPLQVGDTSVDITAVSMGNPHAVQVVADVDTAPVETQGPIIERHPRFPARVNAGFMQIVDRQHIRLRVFERGSGETLACGTGACAAVVTGIARGLLDSPVQVDTRGGRLSIAWAGGNAPVMMTGPAVSVFESEIEI